MKLIGKRVLIAVGVAALGLGGAAASAAIPDQTGAIHGCYAKPGLLFSPPAGSLRVIDSPSEQCRQNEIALSWNATGPQGLQGLQGQPGTQGLKGDPCLSSDPACVGPQGIPGSPGPRGPSDLYAAESNAQIPLPAGQDVTLLTKTIPAGNYLASARVGLLSVTGNYQQISCEILLDGQFVDQGGSLIGASVNGIRTYTPMMHTVAGPGTLSVTCNSQFANSYADRFELEALQVGSVH